MENHKKNYPGEIAFSFSSWVCIHFSLGPVPRHKEMKRGNDFPFSRSLTEMHPIFTVDGISSSKTDSTDYHHLEPFFLKRKESDLIKNVSFQVISKDL
jgi:hypothetical protein